MLGLNRSILRGLACCPSSDIIPSVPGIVQRRRKRLREEVALIEEDGALVFTEDHPFDSPSGAAGVVLGCSSNGWREWVNQQGRTLDMLERE